MSGSTSWAGAVGVVGFAAVLAFAACGGGKNGSGFDGNDGGADDDGGTTFGSDSGFGTSSSGDGGGSSGFVGDPVTCEQAAESKSYIGCDYWPTVTANFVDPIFDFAVVVANAGNAAADITVTGPKSTNQKVTVAPQQLTTIYLPWVDELRGTPQGFTQSVLSAKGAFHLVSSAPVTVYQFNALEYQCKGGPPGKNWGAWQPEGPGEPCLSFTNDASLLLPSTAMTGNYRISGVHGWTEVDRNIHVGAYIAITGTVDGTNVKVKISDKGKVIAGGQIAATGPGGVLSLTLNAGDVAEVLGGPEDTFDLSGSQVSADKPVQVLSGIPCIYMPQGMQACDHVEESVLPAETLGKHYLVTVPTSPSGQPNGHVVRIYGNVDGTTLSYSGAAPCGGTVNAGQVLDCGLVNKDFEVTGDHEFAVASFSLGSEVVDPNATFDQNGWSYAQGDPDQSQMIAVEQYRTKYIFLAPTDYETNYVDVVAPQGTALSLDGQSANATFTNVGVNGLAVARIKLGPGQNGAHIMTGDKPFGLQVMGYGRQTSYQYPGGLDLHAIAPPPPPVK